MIKCEEQFRTILELMKRTVLYGESNSIMLIGPRGSGKTSILSGALAELVADADATKSFLQVHLNGLLQTDDRIALKEITCQLKLENCVNDKVFGSFAENLQFLLDCLKTGGQQSKSIIFILDEFDLFCHHKNQTLLYNLFDISQSAQTPIAVICMTCRMDIMELLEKRVKSRFSHRQIHIFPKYTYQEYIQLCVDLLSLNQDFDPKVFVSEWNSNIKELFKNATVLSILQRTYNTNKDIRALKMLLLPTICCLSETAPLISASSLVDSHRMLTQDSKAVMLVGLSVLELCLIIAMHHLTVTYDGEPFNFHMVYKEYARFAQRKSALKSFQWAVSLKAFAHLQSLEFIKPISTGITSVQKEYQMMALLLEPSQIIETLQRYPGLPTEVQQWATSALV